MTDCDRAWALAAAGDPLPAGLAAHAAGCPSCRTLVALDALLTRREKAPIHPSTALRAALAADHGPVALRTPLRRAVAPALVIAVSLAATALLTPLRGDTGGWLGAGLLTLVAAAGVVLVYHRGRDGLGPAPWLRTVYPLVALGIFALVALAAPGMGRADAWPGAVTRRHETQHGAAGSAAVAGVHTEDTGQGGGVGEVPQGAGGCASYGLVLTLLAGAALAGGARRTVPVAPMASGVCAGVAAGMVGAAALGLHGAAGAGHVLMAHGLPVLAGAGLGAVVGKRVLAP